MENRFRSGAIGESKIEIIHYLNNNVRIIMFYHIFREPAFISTERFRMSAAAQKERFEQSENTKSQIRCGLGSQMSIKLDFI